MLKDKKAGDERLSSILNEFVQQGKIKKGFEQASIQEAWEECMNEVIQKYTKSVRFVKGKLYLDIASASLKQELFQEREKLKRLLNSKLGKPLIEQIIIH